MTIGAWALLGYVIVERAVELPIARRNARALLAAGGHEVGALHYPLLVGVHFAWLAAIAFWIASGRAVVHPGAALVYLLLQPLRFWVMASLGRYWTTRIIVLPEVPLVRSGPYRLLSHPNYAVVCAEIAVLPLAVGAWPLAIVFSLLNAAALAVRLKVETASLRARQAASL